MFCRGGAIFFFPLLCFLLSTFASSIDQSRGWAAGGSVSSDGGILYRLEPVSVFVFSCVLNTRALKISSHEDIEPEAGFGRK